MSSWIAQGLSEVLPLTSGSLELTRFELTIYMRRTSFLGPFELVIVYNLNNIKVIFTGLCGLVIIGVNTGVTHDANDGQTLACRRIMTLKDNSNILNIEPPPGLSRMK